MKDQLRQLSFEIELLPGEKLTFPAHLLEQVGEGRWVITVQPLALVDTTVRGHDGFLKGYAAEDEGLYDDDSGR